MGKIFLALLIHCNIVALTSAPVFLRVKDPVLSVWIAPHELQGPFEYPSFRNPRKPGAVSLKTHLTQLLYGECVIFLGGGDGASGMLHISIPSQLYCNQVTKAWGSTEGYAHERHFAICREQALVTMVVQAVTARVHAEPSEQGALLISLPLGAVVQHATHEIINGYVKITLLDGNSGFMRCCDLQVISEHVGDIAILRNALCENAKKLIGMPYCWGGRSPFFGEIGARSQSDYAIPTSVDCSGVVSLLMHSIGLFVPRNSTGQYAVATVVEPAAMQPGDIFFLQSELAHVSNHMLIYLGDGLVFEARGSDGSASSVRVSPIEKRFGMRLEALRNNEYIDNTHKAHRLLCGSFFSSQETVQHRRNSFLLHLGHAN